MSYTIKQLSPKARTVEKEDKIINAATNLFADIGYYECSTRKIAAAAGVSEATIFHYFGSKKSLLISILSRFYDELVFAANEAVNRNSATYDRMQELATNHLFIISANNALMMRLLHAYFSSDPHLYDHLGSSEIHGFNKKYIQIFDAIIKEGIFRNEIRTDVHIPVIRDIFFGSLEYGMRTSSLKKKIGINELKIYAENLILPLWRDISIGNKHLSVNMEQSNCNSAFLVRLESIFKKIEIATDKL